MTCDVGEDEIGLGELPFDLATGILEGRFFGPGAVNVAVRAKGRWTELCSPEWNHDRGVRAIGPSCSIRLQRRADALACDVSSRRGGGLA